MEQGQEYRGVLVDDLIIEDLEERSELMSGVCACTCSCGCTSTSCVAWA